MTTPEGEVKSAVKDALQKAGWYEWTVNQFNKRGYRVKSGISDLIAIREGRVLFLEIKAGNGKQRPAQAVFQAEIQAHGGEYYVIRSVDELIAIIEGGKPWE